MSTCSFFKRLLAIVFFLPPSLAECGPIQSIYSRVKKQGVKVWWLEDILLLPHVGIGCRYNDTGSPNVFRGVAIIEFDVNVYT